MQSTIEALHRAAPLTDVHAHPSLKLDLLGRKLWKRPPRPSKKQNPRSLRTSFPQLLDGGVGVLWAAHYAPELELAVDIDGCFPVNWLARALVRDYRRFLTGDRLPMLRDVVRRYEEAVAEQPSRAEVARCAGDVDRIVGEGKLAIVHTAEGGHMLDGDVANVAELARLGIASLTLSHFYWNGIAKQVNAVPEEGLASRCRLRMFDGDYGVSRALTSFGEEVVDALVDHGIIVDVAHCTPDARAAVYQRVNKRIPVVATHVGMQGINPDAYNLSAYDVEQIADSGGAVGVILMNYWLHPGNPADGLDAVWHTMRSIHEVTGSWEHVMIGSDFDGLTDPPDDIVDATELWRITARLLREGVAENDVAAILGANARRALGRAWRGGERPDQPVD